MPYAIITSTSRVDIQRMALFVLFLFLWAIQWEIASIRTVTAINRLLYFETAPTVAKPTPLNPSDAKKRGPSQVIQAKKAVITEPILVILSFNCYSSSA